jgi:hypothetical protein
VKCENVSEDNSAIKKDDSFHCENILKPCVQVAKYIWQGSKEVPNQAKKLKLIKTEVNSYNYNHWNCNIKNCSLFLNQNCTKLKHIYEIDLKSDLV